MWVGNNDNSPMERVASGITGATPIWNKIMSSLLAQKPSREWIIPEKLIKVAVCPLTETLACQGCPNVTELFLEENKPKYACSSDWFLAGGNDNETNKETIYSINDYQEDPVEKIQDETIPEIIDMEKKYLPPGRRKKTLGSI